MQFITVDDLIILLSSKGTFHICYNILIPNIVPNLGQLIVINCKKQNSLLINHWVASLCILAHSKIPGYICCWVALIICLLDLYHLLKYLFFSPMLSISNTFFLFGTNTLYRLPKKMLMSL